MDILIKGLALPKKGTTELTIYDDGHVLYEQDDGQYIEMGDAKAIELPPHGRLKDESVIMEQIQALLKERSWIYASHAQEIIDIIRNAPTVMEASK